MSEQSKIEWTDATFNPWIGCTEVSPACANCYARELSNFRGWAEWGKGKTRRRTSEANWRKPLQWNREAERSGGRLKVFCASLADYLDEEVPREWREDLFGLIESTPHLDWLLLTKRTESLYLKLPAEWIRRPRPNVWLGATVESDRYLWRADDLREVPAAVHFLSCEPLLSDLSGLDLTDIQWVIAGGESGPHARPSHPDWFRRLRDKCAGSGVAFHFKQWGEWAPSNCMTGPNPWPYGKGRFANWIRERGAWHESTIPGGSTVLARIGKKAAGRLLDGREWSEFPNTAQTAPR
jgi:protein gp37